MNTSKFFAVFIFISFAFSQPSGFHDTVIVDDFSFDTQSLIILTGPDTDIPSNVSVSTQDNSILGGERDVFLAVTSSQQDDQFLLAEVSSGNYFISYPELATGFSYVQYDGVNGNGLGLNFTELRTTGLRYVARNNLNTNVTIEIAENGTVCSQSFQMSASNTSISYEVYFDSLTDGCSYTNVHSIKIEFDHATENDNNIFTELVHLFGPGDCEEGKILLNDNCFSICQGIECGVGLDNETICGGCPDEWFCNNDNLCEPNEPCPVNITCGLGLDGNTNCGNCTQDLSCVQGECIDPCPNMWECGTGLDGVTNCGTCLQSETCVNRFCFETCVVGCGIGLDGETDCGDCCEGVECDFSPIDPDVFCDSGCQP